MISTQYDTYRKKEIVSFPHLSRECTIWDPGRITRQKRKGRETNSNPAPIESDYDDCQCFGQASEYKESNDDHRFSDFENRKITYPTTPIPRVSEPDIENINNDRISRSYSFLDKKWDRKLQFLVDYKNNQNTIIVPSAYPTLVMWVNRQRIA